MLWNLNMKASFLIKLFTIELIRQILGATMFIH